MTKPKIKRKPGFRRTDETGKFIPKYTDEEVLDGIDAFNQIIPIHQELKKLHNIAMKALRGTKKLDSHTTMLLKEMYSTLANKVVGNAKSGEGGPTELDIVIKAPPKE